jgi:hypothetical protein
MELRRAFDDGDPIVANVANPRDADFNVANGDTTFDGRQLTVTEFMVPRNYPVGQFKSDFPRFQPSGNNVDLQANNEITQVIFRRIMNAAHTQLNNNHSVGDTGGVAPLDLYDGFETLILADADATEVGVGTTLTPANIIDRITALRDAIPPRLRKRPNLKIFCSYAASDMYDTAARNTQTSQTTVSVDGQRFITTVEGGRIEIIPVEGVSTDFAFVTPAGSGEDGNLVQGFWSQSEVDLLKMYRSEEADQNWKLLMRFDVGVQHVTGDDVFYIDGV